MSVCKTGLMHRVPHLQRGMTLKNLLKHLGILPRNAHAEAGNIGHIISFLFSNVMHECIQHVIIFKFWCLMDGWVTDGLLHYLGDGAPQSLNPALSVSQLE